MSRAKLSKLMDAETWMDARAAIDMGFADELLTGERNPMFAVSPEKPNDDLDDDEKRLPFPPKNAGLGTVFSRRAAEQKLVAHLTATSPPKPMRPPHLTTTPAAPLGRRVCDLYAELANQPH